MNKSLYILLALMTLHSLNGLACDCITLKNHDKLIESSYSYYDQIFIGEIVEINSRLWIKVKEVFKGDLKAKQLINIGFEGHSCSYYFQQKGVGLFYGAVTTNEFFASICSPTRMFDSPNLYPPPFPGSKPGSKSDKQKMADYEKAEKERLEYEIQQLRTRIN